ncbi:hypothetical protein D9M69_561780 [compost metagenome]
MSRKAEAPVTGPNRMVRDSLSSGNTAAVWAVPVLLKIMKTLLSLSSFWVLSTARLGSNPSSIVT